jgi:hypothetical protein
MEKSSTKKTKEGTIELDSKNGGLVDMLGNEVKKHSPKEPEVELTEEQLLKRFMLKFAHLFQLDQFQEYYIFSSPIGLIKVNRINHLLSFDMAAFQLTPEEIQTFVETRFKLQIDFLKKA